MLKTPDVVAVFKKHGDHPQSKLIARLLKQQDGEEILFEIASGDYLVSIRRWAVEGLAQGKRRQSVKLAKDALSDPNMSVRLHAMIGFGLSGRKNRIRWLEELLFDESGGIRVNAVVILGKACPGIIKRHATSLLKDKKKYVVQQMARLGY